MSVVGAMYWPTQSSPESAGSGKCVMKVEQALVATKQQITGIDIAVRKRT